MSVVLTSDMVDVALKTGNPTRVGLEIQPRFEVGQRVTARNLNPLGHTRLARYLRGRTGVVEADLGVFTFPDTMAHGRIPSPQHVYSVRFTSQQLWGPEANPHDSHRAGLWDSYLDPADDAAR